jgi:hypothetical protein
MRITVFFVVLLSLLMSHVVAEELTIPADKSVIQFDTKLGTVTFQHQMHAGLTITECKTCHHTMEPGDTAVKPCHDCHKHKEDGEAPKTKTAFHTRCIGCHEYTVEGGGHAGPVKKKCKLCHVK